MTRGRSGMFDAGKGFYRGCVVVERWGGPDSRSVHGRETTLPQQPENPKATVVEGRHPRGGGTDRSPEFLLLLFLEMTQR